MNDQNEKNRVYGEVIDIDAGETISFYDKRAHISDLRKETYSTVLLGDQDPEYARKWDQSEKEFILPKLQINSEKTVLDLGCGLGRWASAIVDSAKAYYGVDFSSEMIAVAKERFQTYDNCYFQNKTFSDALHDFAKEGIGFDVVIIAGVSMYINDDVLTDCYRKLSKVLNKNAIVYIEESVGIKERLTLNHIWSENLQDYYGAIYRTAKEYEDFLKELTEKSVIVEKGYMDFLDKKEFSETGHWYCILNYKGE